MDVKMVDISAELQKLLSSVSGVNGVSEAVTLSYVVCVDDESKKDGVEKVAGLLSSQAEKYGFDLDIAVVTKNELDDAKKKMEEYLKKNASFKA